MIKNNIGTTLISEEEQKGDVQKIYDLKHDISPKIRVVWSESRQYITTALRRNQ